MKMDKRTNKSYVWTGLFGFGFWMIIHRIIISASLFCCNKPCDSQASAKCKQEWNSSSQQRLINCKHIPDHNEDSDRSAARRCPKTTVRLSRFACGLTLYLVTFTKIMHEVRMPRDCLTTVWKWYSIAPWASHWQSSHAILYLHAIKTKAVPKSQQLLRMIQKLTDIAISLNSPGLFHDESSVAVKPY